MAIFAAAKRRLGSEEHAATQEAVGLLKGLVIYEGMDVIEVPGATGYLDTNCTGKADYAVKALDDHDFVYVHAEAPDEAGHEGDVYAKVQAIEDFGEKVVGRVLDRW